VSLQITDNTTQSNSESTVQTVVISPDNKAAGTLTKVYVGADVSAPLPDKADYGVLTSGTPFELQSNEVSAIPTSGAVILQMVAQTFFGGGDVTFTVPGIAPASVQLRVAGTAMALGTSVPITAGQKLLDVRCVPSAVHLPELPPLPLPSPFTSDQHPGHIPRCTR
jgi:hypothetical protein